MINHYLDFYGLALDSEMHHLSGGRIVLTIYYSDINGDKPTSGALDIFFEKKNGKFVPSVSLNDEKKNSFVTKEEFDELKGLVNYDRKCRVRDFNNLKSDIRDHDMAIFHLRENKDFVDIINEKYKIINVLAERLNKLEERLNQKQDTATKPETLSERVKSELGVDISEIDFADHRTINAFFKEYEGCINMDDDEYLDFVIAFENCKHNYDTYGHVTLADVFCSLGEDLSIEQKNELGKYYWMKKLYPFSYQIIDPTIDDEGNKRYYVVFSCPPIYEDDED